ncbi:MAG: PD40 domain-containing protein [Acidobacteria bacterium]|nr:PD40 domain-containing protein [Acidobacteriota bacterium]
MARSSSPAPRSVRTLAVLALLLSASLALPASAQYADSFGKNKVQYRDFDWQIYHSPHFDVYFYTGSEDLLEKVVSLAESAYDTLSQQFDYQIQEPTPLIFYETHSAFEQNNVILNFIPEGVGAFASPVRNRMVLPVDLPDAELYGLIKHELTHIFQYQMLFQGSLAKGLAVSPPLWFMEGMASYMAKDEQTSDRMYLRDAVVNDSIPSITQSGVGGFFAYRFGHAAFDYIEERWGKDGFLDFLYEFRNTIGSRTDRAVERAFKVDPEDFDRDFRKWLRQKYLPQLIETGEPGDFGRPFRIDADRNSQVISPVASPSGDLVAALAIYKGDLDVVLFDAEKRRFIRNLTKGFGTSYQYFSSQFVTTARSMGRDLAFSPDGDQIALFAKRERSRSLVLIDVLHGGIDKIIDLDVEQTLSPTWSPDGRTIAFSGNRNGRFDLFTLDLDSREVTNVTDDETFDGAPVFTPDGNSLVYSAVVGEYAKLFRIDLADPSQRFQLTTGESNDMDATFSTDGKRIYFTSDRTGVDNIHSLDLETGEVRQYTDVVTGCFMPTALREPDGEERLVYTGYWKGGFDLYVTDVDEPLGEPELTEIPSEGVPPAALPVFEPDIQVAVDDANKDKYRAGKFFIEGADAFLGVDDNQVFVGRVIVTMSDYLGDRRLIGIFDSQNSLANFDLRYLNLANRWQWQARLFDQREFYVLQDQRSGQLERLEEAYQRTGLIGSLIYPFTFNTRVEFGLGYIYREFTQPVFARDPDTGAVFLDDFVTFSDNFPQISTSLVSDRSVYASYGAVSGSRWRVDTFYAPDFEAGGTLFVGGSVDARKYLTLTRRSNLALRFYGAVVDGNNPGFYSVGGLDTLRGFAFRELSGDRVAFANIEYRFPLIDYLATPVFQFQGIRGRVFFDVGAVYFKDQDFEFYNSDENRLENGVAAYGFGFTVRFIGLDLNWDFSKRWNLETSSDGFRTDFYIGTRF